MYKNINEYLNHLFPVPITSKLLEIREEYKSHLEDSVHECVLKGYSEEQSIQMAISNFGDTKTLKASIRKLRRNNKRNKRVLFALCITLLVSLCTIQIIPFPIYIMLVTVLAFSFLGSWAAALNVDVVTHKNEELKDANNIGVLGGLGMRYKENNSKS